MRTSPETIDTPARVAVGWAVVAFLTLALTAPAIPIVWDEGEYLVRADQARGWFGLLVTPGDPHGGLRAFSRDAILEHWKFISFEEGHPAGAAVPMVVSSALFERVLHPLTAARLGPILVFSLACGAVAFRMRRQYGRTAALVAPAAILTFPRLFAEAHFATLDGTLTAWWLMLWAADASGRSDVRASIGVGVLAGMTGAAKFPGWLAWAPVELLRMCSRDRRRQASVLVVAAAGLATFYVVNPPLWHDPIAMMTRHVSLNLHRTLNVPMAFFGRIYDLHTPLPWYNTIAWLLIVTPVPVLVLGSIGVVRCCRVRDAAGIGLLMHFAMLMIVRAVPGAPPHDGIRLFVPAVAFWCVLAGVGAQSVWDASRGFGVSRAMLARGAIVAGLAAGAVNVARYYPQTLSHYNLLVGGLRGAARLGMEPTYWCDALDGDVLRWLNTSTAPGATVAFSARANLAILRGWKLLTTNTGDPRYTTFQWYVLQNRTGFLGETDKVLMRTAQPAYVKYAGRYRGGRVPADLDVPLLLIYSYEQYKAAEAIAYPR